MLKINDLITSGESFSVRKPKRRSAFYESASIIVQGKELDSRWDTFNLTKYMAFSEAGPEKASEGPDQKNTKEKPTGIWAKAKNLAKNTWEWIKRVFKRFREWLADTWKKIKEWFGKTFKKNKKDASPEAQKAADKMEAAADTLAATVIKEAEKVTSGGDVTEAQEKVEAVKAAATAVTNIQKTVTKKMAESTRRRKGMRGAGAIPGSEFEVKKGKTRKQTERTRQWMTR